MSYSELRCFKCSCGTGVFYLKNGAPFCQLFYCESCKVDMEQEECTEEEDNA